MNIRVPHYYKDFKCIASECTDTCCAGWEVDVDKASCEYYKTVKGEFGERIKSVMIVHENGEANFTLRENGWCPFLNEKKLCDLYTALGEDKLCETCTDYPRFIEEYGNTREIGLALSCKTAGELILKDDTPMTFENNDDGKVLTTYNDIDPQLYFYLSNARRTAYGHARNRQLSICQRYVTVLDYADALQKDVKKKKYSDIDKGYPATELTKTKQNYILYENMKKYWQAYSSMEVINSDWTICVKDVEKYVYESLSKEEYYSCLEEFCEYYADRMYEYEHLLMYFLYRYFLKTVDDKDVLTKVKMACVSYMMIRELDMARWLKNGKSLSKEEQVDIMHLYSRQVEHSYDNFEKLSKLLAQEKMFNYDIIRGMLAEV